jgi:transcriptional regulator with XRE-family HTH domain
MRTQRKEDGLMETALRSERKRRNWKVYDVAQRVGITAASLSRIERRRIRPSAETLIKLEELYNLPGKELFKEVYSPREAIKDG